MQRSTSRLLLSPPRTEDLASLFAIYGDPGTNQYNPAGPLTLIDQAETLLEDWIRHWAIHGYGLWAIATRASPDCVIGFGGIGLRKFGEVERLNLGYRLAVTAWGQGYATELSRAALEYGFDELEVPEIFALVRPAHAASIGVLEKIGMQRVEVLDDVPGQAPSLVYKISLPLIGG
ncbi:GNAT family N-acetyltransferase [Pseudomonas sp. NPDC099000]|uniref:GNAT family N-acetyltransferase n=1 Tax=Pseudomonas sp. NPDC099000 TaxID=3364488 RepID=UPI003839D0F7